jgi:hypothetical protein
MSSLGDRPHLEGAVGAPEGPSKKSTVHRFSTGAGFAPLRPAWNGLVAQSARPWLYLTHEWMTDWWQTSGGPPRELFVLLAERGTDPDIIAPLVRIVRGVPGASVKRLELMSMGTYAYSPRSLSASLEFITKAGAAEPIRAITDYLSTNPGEWDYLRLHPLPEGSETLTELVRWAGENGYPSHVRQVFSNAVIELPDEWETFLKTLSPQFRKHLRHNNNTVEKAGGFRTFEITTADNLDALLDRMAEIETRSWKHSGGVSLSDPEVRASYASQLRVALAVGGLTLWILEKDGKNIAYDLGIRYRDTVESLRGSFDMDYGLFSPGHYLVVAELKAFVTRGIRRVNFLWGDLAYKMKWTKKIEACHELYLFNRTLKGRALHAAYIRTGLYRGIRFLRNFADRPKKAKAAAPSLPG